ncbi:beta-N-acetylhexosaminidase family protein [Halopolyspora algeriensis]|nr:beta-N-acetylglucosaminidase domain-containing protein [Halopolyspora algeriensis]
MGCSNNAPVPATSSSPQASPSADSGGQADLPQVTPQPRTMTRLGQDVRVRGTVEVVVDPLVDRPTRELAVRVLRSAGASHVVVREPGPAVDGATLSMRLGHRKAPSVVKGIQHVGFSVPPPPLPPEGYVLAARGGDDPTLVLGAGDSAGAYYAVQTLRQLATPGRIAGVGIVDKPQMSTRGTIEGFYGSPWTHAERMDQLAFYGEVKLNTYIYAPKDDPYHRRLWREPYPREKLARLGELIGQAAAHHVTFTFALSPGTSICYSDPADFDALRAKLQQLYDAGVRSFSVPLDDISYTEWNCSADRAEYGPPSPDAAGRAQADLLNRVQREFIDTHPDTQPLQTVPTEYSDVEDSPYKTALRTQLDPRVQVMWTGVGVIPDEVTVADARRAAQVWGRKVMLWDNYPVNDFDGSTGRLLLGPYAQRRSGLHEHLSGLVVNPMNQAAASKVVEIGAAGLAWNSADFDPQRAWHAAAEHLAGDRFAGDEQALRPDPETVEALMVFFDLNHMAPLPSGEPWLAPAPELARRLDEFRAAWRGGDRSAALRQLRGYAEKIAGAPERIREGAAQNFVSDATPWLQATDLWGDSLLATVDGLRARLDGDEAAARRYFGEAADLADRAGSVRTVPGETLPQGPVRVADGVLDTFIRQAPELR